MIKLKIVVKLFISVFYNQPQIAKKKNGISGPLWKTKKIKKAYTVNISNYSIARPEYHLENKRAYRCYIVRMSNKLKYTSK